jgi:hypothetical protein
VFLLLYLVLSVFPLYSHLFGGLVFFTLVMVLGIASMLLPVAFISYSAAMPHFHI